MRNAGGRLVLQIKNLDLFEMFWQKSQGEWSVMLVTALFNSGLVHSMDYCFCLGVF